MDCHRCGKRGERVGTWRACATGRPWAVLRCRCVFEFRSAIDGKRLTARPTWMIPEKEYRPC